MIVPNSGRVPPVISLGTLYVAAFLREKGLHQVKIIDARGRRLSETEVREEIGRFSPDIAGITALSMEAPQIHALAALIKQEVPGCKVVVGGAYATSYREVVLEGPEVDFIVIGEGEKTMLKLTDAIEKGKDPAGIDGIGFRDDGKATLTAPVTPIEDIDSIPMPAWDLIDLEGYFNSRVHRIKHSQNPVSAFKRIVPLVTSRGCPFGCIFCHNIFGKQVRLRRVKDVVDEIETMVRRYGVQEFEVIDDIFNIEPVRAKGICDEIIARGLKVHLSFPNALRADMVDEELVLKLKKAGTYLICYAVDSATPRVQKEINKNLDLEKTREIIDMTVGHGIITAGYFMLGFPGETREDMLRTINFALKSKFHLASFFYVTAFPNTALARRLSLKAPDREHFVQPNIVKLTQNYSAVPDSEFIRLVGFAYRKFYINPSRIWRIWKAFPDKIVLLRNSCTVLIRFSRYLFSKRRRA